MFQDLPIELALAIFCEAAKSNVCGNRAWVVQLALVSRNVYALVSPVLYHSMVITLQNQDIVFDLADDALHANITSRAVFHSVRRLAVTFDIGSMWETSGFRWQREMFPRLFVFVTEFNASLTVLAALSRTLLFQPRRIVVIWASLWDLLHHVSPRALKQVTHVEGYLPASFEQNRHTPREWILAILGALPAITHLGFRQVDTQPDPDRWNPDDGPLPVVHHSIKVKTLKEVLCAVLEQKRIECVAIRVGGERIADLQLVQLLLSHMKDPRLSIWGDKREIKLWSDEDRVSAEDAWAERDIWTEARSL